MAESLPHRLEEFLDLPGEHAALRAVKFYEYRRQFLPDNIFRVAIDVVITKENVVVRIAGAQPQEVRDVLNGYEGQNQERNRRILNASASYLAKDHMKITFEKQNINSEKLVVKLSFFLVYLQHIWLPATRNFNFVQLPYALRRTNRLVGTLLPYMMRVSKILEEVCRLH